MSTGSTPNYSFSFPLPTDPVNLAGDIQNLATDIDSFLAASSFGPKYPSITSKTSSYTFSLTDAGSIIRANSSSNIVLTIPNNSIVPFPIGTRIEIFRSNTGEVEFSGESGVVINSESSNLKINAQWQSATLLKYLTNTWLLTGSLKP